MIRWSLVASFLATMLIPFSYLANIMLAFNFGQTIDIPTIIRLLGAFISLVGLIFWILSYINLGSSFGVLPQKQKRVKKGIYKKLRHPMYIGISLTFLGLSLLNASLPGLLFLLVFIVPLLFVRAKLEDKKLSG